MTVSDYYLVCFIVGLALSAISFLLGNLHIHLHMPFHMHLPGMGHGPHIGMGHAGHVHMGGAHAPSAHAGGAPQSHAGSAGGELPYINFGTITAFLAWFGGMGFLLSRHTHLYFWSALAISVMVGLCGSTIVFMAVSKLLVAHEHVLDAYENHPLGALGRVVSGIREGGTGEIIFYGGGRRMTCGARAEDGSAVAKGTEVVVTRYEKGIAYVRTWDDANAEVDAVNSSRRLGT